MKLIPTAEAAKILGVTAGSLRLILGEPDDKRSLSPRGGHKTNVYKRERVVEAYRKRLIKKKHVPKVGLHLRKCLACNGEFLATPYQRHCEHCRDGLRVHKGADPYGVMLKPQYRGRKCPVCGTPVATGQYKCADCKAMDQTDHGFCEGNYVYGGGVS